MDKFADLHERILEKVKVSGWDTFAAAQIRNKDPLVQMAVNKFRKKEAEQHATTGKRKNFAFTEPYWRQWNADLKLLEEISSSAQVEPVLPKKNIIVEENKKRKFKRGTKVNSTTFGSSGNKPDTTDTVAASQLVCFLRTCAGKSNAMPDLAKLTYEPKQRIRGGIIEGKPRTVEKSNTQMCSVVPLPTLSTKGACSFPKSFRFPDGEKRPPSSSTNRFEERVDSLPSTSQGISFSMATRFDTTEGKDNGPGPGEYQVRLCTKRVFWICHSLHRSRGCLRRKITILPDYLRLVLDQYQR